MSGATSHRQAVDAAWAAFGDHRNITGADQTHRLLHACQKHVSTPLFTCVDLEGGTVDRFRKVLGPAPSPAGMWVP